MDSLCFFSEFKLDVDDGSINDYLVENVSYDKKKVVSYLRAGKKLASCPRQLADPISKQKFALSFSVLSDGEYRWVDVLPDLIDRYNIKLPDSFVKKIR